MNDDPVIANQSSDWCGDPFPITPFYVKRGMGMQIAPQAFPSVTTSPFQASSQ